MDNMNNVDTSVNTGVQPQETSTQQTNIEPSSQVQDTQPTTTSTPLTELEIEGIGKVKIDELKEWKQGYLRQQDYTRKTQALAKQRAELKDALEIYNYLKNNPMVAHQIANGQMPQNIEGTPLEKVNPITKQVADVQRELALIKLENDIKELKSKYPDFDEVETLTKAEELGITDLEFVWNAIRGAKMDNLKETIEKEVRASLTEQIKKNGLETQTIISTGDKTNKDSVNLTAEEILIAQKMGIDPKVYAQYKNS